jgi:hypothetical protein
VNKEAQGCSGLGQSPDKLPCLLSDPSIIGLGGAAREMDAARAEFDKEEHIQRLQAQSFDREEVAREHLVSIVLQKRAPRASSALRRRQQAMTAQDIPDSGRIEDESKLQQFTLDLPIPLYGERTP